MERISLSRTSRFTHSFLIITVAVLHPISGTVNQTLSPEYSCMDLSAPNLLNLSILSGISFSIS